MNKTGIEYLDFTWNPIAMKCTPISEGCEHCWHIRMVNRMCGMMWPDYRGLVYKGACYPILRTDELAAPKRRKKSARIGVQFMGDLFHEDVAQSDIHDIFYTMGTCPQHIFMILTKRPARMAEFIKQAGGNNWKPESHIWLGVTAENQKRADERIPILLQIPAAVRFVSVEPMLGPVSLREWINPMECGSIDDPANYSLLDWVICGAETQSGKRPMEIQWARDLRDQCAVPFFFKRDSDGNRTLDGKMWEQWPEQS